MLNRRGHKRRQPPKCDIIAHFEAKTTIEEDQTASLKLVVRVDKMVTLRVWRSRTTRLDGEEVNNPIILEMSIKGQPGWSEVGRF